MSNSNILFNQIMKKISNLRRIQNEVKDIVNDSSTNCIQIKMISDNIYKYIAEISGPIDSLYEGYKFKLSIDLSDDYPFSPPSIKFLTPIKHLNINSTGNICLDLLKDNWKPLLSIKSILMSIILLLSEPNISDPLDSDLAVIYRTNKKEYATIIKKYCENNREK